MGRKGSRVPLWHPEYRAKATPLKEHLQQWLDKGWVRQAEQPEKEGDQK